MRPVEVLAAIQRAGVDVSVTPAGRLVLRPILIDGIPPCAEMVARLNAAALREAIGDPWARRCPACGSIAHTTPGAPGCDRREVVSARRYPAPLLWRGSEEEWTAGAPQPPLGEEVGDAALTGS